MLFQVLLSCCIFFAPVFHSYGIEPYIEVENKARLPILTPSFAERKTLKLKLANGLETYIISDPKAVQSASALIVETGSWSDPQEAPGIAHFLEHMLFLGTEKYPIESDYDRFIKEHKGDSNAYTASDHTLYVFSVNNDAFEEALDRFSYFFKKPLFNPSGVSRELEAIDQEFAKNFSSDDIREHYINKELANPENPFHAFSAGNTGTLSKVSQKTLRNWYQEHYSANLMHLMVYSPLPLETLKNLVIQDFKDIPNTNRAPTKINVPITSTLQKKHIVYIESLRNIRKLQITWELPPQFAHMRESDPAQLICYVMGHEGSGSLLEDLKRNDLAENITCSGQYMSPDHYLLSLDIGLTEKGLQERDVVIQKCFGTLEGLKQKGIPAYIFDELKKVQSLRYQYQSREDPYSYLMKIGEWTIRENLESFPEHTFILQQYDPKAVQQLLDYLAPEQAWITIMAKPEASGIRPDRKEHWMSIPYAIRPITQMQMDLWKKAQPTPSWHLPDSNPFIPKNITVSSNEGEKKSEELIPHPITIIDDEHAKIYYAQDTDFQIPKTAWTFEINTPFVRKSIPREIALADLYTSCLTEVLNPYSYNAKMADLDYSVSRTENGIGISLQGYPDNAEILFDSILKPLKEFNPSQKLFTQFQESLLREYRNFLQESPVKQGMEVYKSIIYQDYSTHSQKAEALQTVTYEEFLDYCTHLFDRTYTLGLFYGSVEKEQALRISQKLQNTLSSRPYPKEEQTLPKIAVFPQDQGPFLLNIYTISPGNTAILGIEDANFSFKTRAAQQILSQVMNGPFYQTLRTQQQTGYIVYNSAEELERRLFNFFLVQSSTYDPRDLLARFELFIETFLQEMAEKELTQERFEVIRQSLLTNLEQPPQSLSAMADLLKTLAFKYDGDFDWISKRIQGFKDLTYPDFLEIAIQSLGKANKRRLAILVYGASSKEKGFEYIRLLNAQEMRQLIQYSRIRP